MFPWNIAKSAEAMFSRWAVKRVCKFLLKKKLGKFILGDVDLDQLEVQLSDGTIQLNDLALNVDYINKKLGSATSVIIKEGSIGSLLVKMPWKGKGCQVEVNEVELIVAPCPEMNSTAGGETCCSSQDDNQYIRCTSGKFGHEMAGNMAKSASSDIHEGVKTIAKMVKWFLTSFNVKINKLIVAFDPCLEKDEKVVESERTLVLRIMEIECGTGMSEDAESKLGSFLGISQLTNFVKFQGAVVELLHMDRVSDQTCSSCASGETFGCLFLCSCSSNIATSVLVGEKGEFSGSLRLSIPWKNGSLDIRKVDADIYVDPILLRFQPSTIKWFLLSWEIYRSLGKGAMGPNHTKLTESDFLNAASDFSSTPVSSAITPDNVNPIRGSVPSDFSSLAQKQTVFEAMLPGSHFIQDWVPFPVSESQKESIVGGELELGASVDQFFECFDGLRNSQSALGSSGMWNWTCSVFSAITAASSLASGSLHIPSEQQHVQTNLKATFAGLCIMFSFDDEDKLLCDQKGNQINNSPNLHYMGAECREILVGLQVCPQEMRVDGTIKCIEVSDYLCNGVITSSLGGCVDDCHSQTHLIQNLQAKVQGSLPPFFLFAEDSVSEKLSGLVAAGFLFGNNGGMTKVMLVKTSGFTHFRFNVNLNPSDGNIRSPAKFSLELPPFIFWVNFWLITALLNLLKEVAKCVDVKDENNEFPVMPSGEKHRSTQDIDKGGPCPGVKVLPSIESLRGEISVLNARIIFCFPFESPNHLASYLSWDQYIALDFRSLSNVTKGMIQDNTSISGATSQKRFTPRATQSLHLIMGSLDVYLVTSASSGYAGINSCDMGSLNLGAEHVISTSISAGSFSIISMLWQEGPISGPWIAEQAKSLATSGECGSMDRFMGEGYEFATVTSATDMEGKHTKTRAEIVSSSEFLLHISLFSMRINLGSAQYNVLNCLLDQMVNASKCFACDSTSINTETSVSQTSILVECDSLEIAIRPDIKKNVKSSIQNELPGSWHHLKLKIQKLNLLSVSNIGAIRGATFFWLAHGKGNLWGSITGLPDQEFLLISCSNSTMKRGDGGGSNALSSSLAGSDILHLWEPEKCISFTSITVRCGTFVAVGGRLDWLDSISSFFILSSSEVEDSGGNSSQKGELSAHHGSSFVLKLVDVGLSYEPYLKKLVSRGDLSSPSSFKGQMLDPVGCLLAASSLTLLNTTFSDSINDDYMIRVQDLGFLIGAMSESTNIDGNYSVGHLHRIGYTRVAREALIEVIFRTNSKNGLLWEIECLKSHIYLETCHDTTSGLIRLIAQLQQLFAPDVEDSLAHLQSRWNNFQQVQETNEYNDERRIPNRDTMPSASLVRLPTVDFDERSRVCGLMDEISEIAFHFDHANQSCEFNFSESQGCASLDENLLGEACSIIETPEISSDGLFINESVPLIGLENNRASFLEEGYIPEVIEGYCVSKLRSLSELSVGRQPEVLICRSRSIGDGDTGIRNGGWYGDSPLKIVENHISDTNEEAKLKEFLEDKYRPDDCAKHADSKEATGRVLFDNVNVIWRMYAGSDWHESRKNEGSSFHFHGRDTTACLELTLSGMRIQYDTFPQGGTCVSKLSLSVQDFYLSDMGKAAPWKLVLGYYNSKDHPRESSSKALKLELEAVRPDPLTPLEENRLCIAFLPLLLHLHQSQLDFLIDFFAKSSLVDHLDGHQDSAGSATSEGHAIPDEALLPFFQKFDIWPILVRVDYRPTRVDLAALGGGKYVELVNLIPWKGIELQLKHVHSVGLYGWGSVCETIMGEWLEDISQNQIHKVLQGIPTVRSLVAVGAGAAKLVSLPVENYRKDRRVLKGMQRGTIAFLRSLSLEAVGLGVHLAAGAHDILLQAECILTSIPPSVSWPVQDKRRSNQPKNAQQGIHQAYESLSDGLEKSASALVRTPLKKYQRGASAGSALATAVRAAPAAAIAPASACASAVHYALLGLRNSLDPEHKKESLEKYLGPSQL